jgi:WD40 repeat protein
VRGVSAGADLLASVGLDGAACIWSLDRAQPLHTLKHNVALKAVALSPDGNLLACGGDAKKVFLWHPRTGKNLGEIDGHLNAGICALAFAPSGNQLAVATQAELVLFDRVGSEFRRAARLLEGQYVVSSVAYSGDGKRLAACTYQHSVFTWDTATLTPSRAPGKQPSWLEAVALSADGSRVVFGTRDGDYFLWRPPQPPRRLETTRRSASALLFVPGRDTFLAAGEWAGPLRLCDLAAGERVDTFAGPPEGICSLCFAREGKLLAGACTDGAVYLWDVRATPQLNPATGEGK